MQRAAASAFSFALSAIIGPHAVEAFDLAASELKLERAAVEQTLPNERRLPLNRVVPTPPELAGFRIELDATTGRPQRAVGGSLAWLPGRANQLPGAVPTGAARRQELLARAFAFVAEHPTLYALDRPHLAVNEEGTVSIEAAELDVVRLSIVAGDLAVLGGNLVFVVRYGDLVYFGSSYATPPAPGGGRVGPILDGDAARARILGRAGLAADAVAATRVRRERFLLPTVGGDHRAIRAIRFRPLDGEREWEGWVDEVSGDVVALFAAELEACAPDPRSTRGRAMGGVRPAVATESEAWLPLAYVDLGGGRFADHAGAFDYVGAPLRSSLAGRYVTINCLSCTNPLQASAATDEAGMIDYLSNRVGDVDALGNGTSTVASRTAYRHVTTAHELAAKWLGTSLGFLTKPVEVQVNGLSSCNAQWSGFAVKLARSADGCRNTGQVRDIVVHEWGHALDDFDGTGISDRGLSEGLADQMAVLLDRNSCIGDSIFALAPTPPASTGCLGVRDLDERAPGLAHLPATLTMSVNDCGGGTHCLGEVLGQASWHLLANLATGLSYDDGTPIGPALGEDNAYELVERYYMLSRPIVEVMSPLAAGLSVYDGYLIVDRQPSGNHPHAAYINEAFGHHQLTETPVIDPVAVCARPASPVLAAIAESRVDGSAGVVLQWNDVDAWDYRVLGRRADTERAWLPLGPPLVDDNRPTYWMTDADLQNGVTHEFMVIARGADGCEGLASAPVSVPLAFPELAIARSSELDPLPGGDGDGVPEPSEFITVGIELREELGLAGATGLTATLTSLDPLVRVAAGPPVDFPDIPAGGGATGGGLFTIYIEPGHDCRGRVPLILAISHSSGCLLRAFDIELPSAACPTTDRSDVRFLSARVVDDTGIATCTDRDGLPDTGEQTRILVTVENQGTATASSTEVLMSSGSSELSFVSGSRVTDPTPLAPGARRDATFDLLVGEIGCETTVSLATEVRAPENLAPDLATFEVVTESDLVPATLSWDFEVDAGGWSGDGLWTLTTTRSNPDDRGQSFYSGSGFNQCSTLRSGAITLHPSAPSTLTLASWYELQGRYQANYWDGVNLYVRRSTGVDLLSPASGRGYDWPLVSVVLCEGGQPAWSSNTTGKTWRTSTFDLSPYAGETISLEVHYATDNRDTKEGFYLDDVVVTNAVTRTCDGHTCVPDPDCSTPLMTLVATPSCVGNPVSLRADFDFFGLGSFDFEWDFGDGNLAATAIPDAPIEHVYLTPGGYFARLTARSVSNPLCSSSASLALTVAPSPWVAAGPDGDGPVTIGTPGFAAVTYRWDPASGLADSRAAMTLASPLATTEYCLTATATVSGCATEDCTVVRVPSSCGIASTDIDRLYMVRRLVDVHGEWTPLLVPANYQVYRLDAKERITSAEAWNTKAVLVSEGAGTTTDDPGAVVPPPLQPGLIFYQVIPLCR